MLNGIFLRFCINPFDEKTLNSPKLIMIFLPTKQKSHCYYIKQNIDTRFGNVKDDEKEPEPRTLGVVMFFFFEVKDDDDEYL